MMNSEGFQFDLTTILTLMYSESSEQRVKTRVPQNAASDQSLHCFPLILQF